MGYWKDSEGIKNFTPDDTDNSFWIDASYGEISFTKIFEMAQEKWGKDISFTDLEIKPHHIHVRCIGYDKYDSNDYDNYLEITRLSA